MLVLAGALAQLAIVAHAPGRADACDAIELSVAVRTSGREIPTIVAPPMRPFDVLRSTAHPRVATSQGSIVAEYRYTLVTDRTGRHVLPPFEARVGGRRAASTPLVIEVRPRRTRAGAAILTRARADTSAELGLTGPPIAADTVFVGQQVTYEVAVFLNQAMRERLRRNPTFYPPDMQSVLAYDLPAPSPNTSYRTGSQCFDALVYRRALFPLVPGRLTIAPAQLVYNTAVSSTSLFSREESHELETDSVTFMVLDPPREGRPAPFTGAVGRWSIDAIVDSAARVGDPMLLTVRVSGTGNVRLLPRPPVAVPWGSLVSADERVRLDSGRSRISGFKEFDWVLTPRVAGEFDLPPVRYGFFDAGARRYDAASTLARRVQVRSGALATGDTTGSEGVLPLRPRYRGPAWPPPQSLPMFWALLALAPVPALAALARRRRPSDARQGASAPIQALASGQVAGDPVALRRQYVRALADRIGCSPSDFTHAGALEQALRRAGVTGPTARRAEDLLRMLDDAAYAPHRPVPSDAEREAREVARAVDAEGLARAELPMWLPVILVAAALSAAATAFASDPAATYFARGVSAYLREDYGVARQSFAASLELQPRSPDAWANFGTASLSGGDTASAVVGWRQALALQPAAADLRGNVELLRGLAPSEPGWVPPMPAHAAVWAFAILWLATWMLAWSALRHRRVTRWPLPVGAAALLVAFAATEIEALTVGARLAVVRRALSVTSDPALGMDRGAALGTGEIVHVLARRGGWTLVRGSADREGWVATSRLHFLDERRPPRD